MSKAKTFIWTTAFPTKIRIASGRAALLSHKLPAGTPRAEDVPSGLLLSYGQDFPDFFRRAAGYADKILKGAKPADLPVEQPTNEMIGA
jgi:ABC-type uncharacterized transport system substrate-binding protein